MFAVAEMILSPRYYEYFSSFAPKGREAMYMGFAVSPVGFGGLVGGVLSGYLITKYLPAEGPRSPLIVWGHTLPSASFARRRSALMPCGCSGSRRPRRRRERKVKGARGAEGGWAISPPGSAAANCESLVFRGERSI